MISYFNYNRSSLLVVLVRYKSKTHWTKLKTKSASIQRALKHFDDFYGSVFKSKWEPMKAALLRSPKYVAVINNYGDPEEVAEVLSKKGAHCLKKLMEVEKQFQDVYCKETKKKCKETNDRLEEFTSRTVKKEIADIYPDTSNIPEVLETVEFTLGQEKKNDLDVKEEIKASNTSLKQSLECAEFDETRIIDPSLAISAESLWQYVPTTKLMGRDDWIPESQHYAYYSKSKDFPLVIEEETCFKYPEHLKIMTYEMGSEYQTFSEPRRCKTGVYNYYPLDCGSVLTVLALCLEPGDRVLDLCSAPGGKSLLILQTLLPDVLICNDVSISRSNRLKRVFRDYLYDFENSDKWRERVLFKQVDGRVYKDEIGFDKVLVDVPCTTDRHSVTENENNIFRADRIKERLKIPEVQSELLANALRLVKVGGAVVYSTCSLSPIQNDGVVHMALKLAFETHGIQAIIRDVSSPMALLKNILHLGSGKAAPLYGQLVTPEVDANFGPTYFARLVRVQ